MNASDATGATADNHTAGAPQQAATSVRLDDHAVLCVGGRASALPLYRLIVERCGARFMHHDADAQDSSARLDATLAAADADAVICQTGCVSHNAYWRVKDHCKRTGKPLRVCRNAQHGRREAGRAANGPGDVGGAGGAGGAGCASAGSGLKAAGQRAGGSSVTGISAPGQSTGRLAAAADRQAAACWAALAATSC